MSNDNEMKLELKLRTKIKKSFFYNKLSGRQTKIEVKFVERCLHYIHYVAKTESLKN